MKKQKNETIFFKNPVLKKMIKKNDKSFSSATKLMNHQHKTLILSGDVPLIRVETLKKMIDLDRNCVILTAKIENPYGYGRIVRKDDIFLKIQEENDCTIEEKRISEINAGIYLISPSILKEIKNNEYLDMPDLLNKSLMKQCSSVNKKN